MGKPRAAKVKGLVLAGIFMQCHLRQRILSVKELLDADFWLHYHFGKRPRVLSNTLRRYKKLGLLRRDKYSGRGCPYRYSLTSKGFNRLWWMATHSEKYLYRDIDIVKPLIPLMLLEMERKRNEIRLRNIRRISQLGSDQ